MNKSSFILLLTFVSIVFSLSIVPGQVSATVGGPTYVSSIAFNVQDNSVYYSVHDGGGRGCPTIIHKINLTTLKDLEVKSCSQVEQEFLNGEYEQGIQKYAQFMADTYQGLPYLGSVSLKKNNIDIDVKFISENVAEDGEVYWREFDATITQDGKTLSTTHFRGCSKDQPHIFEGYRIPNTDAMAVLISNKGDCFEGGYVRESLSIVKGVKYYDTNIVRSIKEESATEPNTGNVVVYAASDDTGNGVDSKLVWTVVALIVGTVLGYLLGRRFS